MNKEVNYGIYFIKQKDKVSTRIRVLIICLSSFLSCKYNADPPQNEITTETRKVM